MEIKFGIDLTGDDKFVVIANWTGEIDGWADITNPFDTEEEAIEWAKNIKDGYGVAKLY